MQQETVFHTIASQNTKRALEFVKSKGMNPRNPDELVANLGKIYLDGSNSDKGMLASIHPHLAFIEDAEGSAFGSHSNHKGHHNADGGYMGCSGCGGGCSHSADGGSAPAPAPAPKTADMTMPLAHHSHNIMATGLFIVAIFGIIALAGMKGEKHRAY